MKDTFLQPIRFIAQKLYVRYKRHQRSHSSSPTATDTSNEFSNQNDPTPSPEIPKTPPIMESIQKEPIAESSIPQSDSSSKPKVESHIHVEYSETPNPNACKYDVSTSVATESFSFSDQEKAKDHPLAWAILSIDGIASVFGVHTFITVTKSPQHSWNQLHPQVIQALQQVLS